ncbi:class I SAM-dependent methyltransferase [Phycicoccus sp. HDW14]|uniref:class I SAM-dependent methyltransferase n=1 Tax=Phycicoccus sp. HDW14 TaxID=2714941 RepID=UPI00140C8DFE|nr:class I SAM-dependent methyltransferase [Phycicoccus sp. HDW14]QIM22275.1 class I SAM-dependent methyltransferase [Phycicoccus sp. HDW14]
MTVHHTAPASPEVKARHRAVWALGDYPSVADLVIPTLGPILVAACDVRAGERVLDVAAGSGNASLPAARTGADVTASDLTPELLDAGRTRAEAAGLELLWDVADAEDLPYPDATFDVVMSCVGVMFAPIHEAAADELVRVCRPGGRIGLIAWTPEGFIGRLLAALRPWAPPPPAGAQPPPLWGSEDHVRGLLGDAVTDVRAERRDLVVDAFTAPEEFRRFFVERYGPTAAVHRSVAGDPEQQAAVEAALDGLAREADEGHGRMRWEYLLLTATRT